MGTPVCMTNLRFWYFCCLFFTLQLLHVPGAEAGVGALWSLLSFSHMYSCSCENAAYAHLLLCSCMCIHLPPAYKCSRISTTVTQVVQPSGVVAHFHHSSFQSSFKHFLVLLSVYGYFTQRRLLLVMDFCERSTALHMRINACTELFLSTSFFTASFCCDPIQLN